MATIWASLISCRLDPTARVGTMLPDDDARAILARASRFARSYLDPLPIMSSSAARLRDWLNARDPAFERAISAARSLAGAALGGGLSYALLHAAGVSGHFAMVAMVAMMGGQMMPGPTRDRLRFAATAALCVSLSVAAAALLSPWPLASQAGMLAALVCGALALRWGPRGAGPGFMLVLTHIMTCFFGAKPHDAPWLVVAALCGASSLALIALASPERPHSKLERLVAATRALVDELLTTALKAARQDDPARARSMLIEAAHRVQDVALRIDATLDALDPSHPKRILSPDLIRERALRVELEADHLAALVSFAVRDKLDRAPLIAGLSCPRAPSCDLATQAAQRLLAATDALALALAQSEAAPATAPPAPADQLAATAEPPPSLAHTSQEIAARKAVQIAIAGALALAAGHMLSHQYWLYSVIGAVVVVLAPSSRGAALRRALDRAIGTAIGVAFGFAAALLLAGYTRVEIGVIVALLFVAFWALPTSYITGMALFSVMVGLLYDLMGRFTPELLMLRLWETAAGAAIGALVAMLVLPLSTRRAVDAELVDGLRAVDGLLGELERTAAPLPPAAVQRHLRAVSRAVSELRAVTRPLLSVVPQPAVRRRQPR